MSFFVKMSARRNNNRPQSAHPQQLAVCAHPHCINTLTSVENQDKVSRFKLLNAKLHQYPYRSIYRNVCSL